MELEFQRLSEKYATRFNLLPESEQNKHPKTFSSSLQQAAQRACNEVMKTTASKNFTQTRRAMVFLVDTKQQKLSIPLGQNENLAQVILTVGCYGTKPHEATAFFPNESLVRFDEKTDTYTVASNNIDELNVEAVVVFPQAAETFKLINPDADSSIDWQGAYRRVHEHFKPLLSDNWEQECSVKEQLTSGATLTDKYIIKGAFLETLWREWMEIVPQGTDTFVAASWTGSGLLCFKSFIEHLRDYLLAEYNELKNIASEHIVSTTFATVDAIGAEHTPSACVKATFIINQFS